MTETKQSLMEELYIDNGSFDEKKAVAVLKSVVSVQREEHLLFSKRGISLKASDKILAYGIVKKLLKMDGSTDENSFSAKEVSQKTGLKQGTVDPTIKKLKEDGFLTGKGSSYEIPVHQVDAVLEQLEMYTAKKND